MESTTTARQFLGAEASLSEPHFDEEATVLAARPVVPLAIIQSVKAAKVKTSFPRPWILALALVGALLAGSFATAIYYSRSNSKESRLSDETQVAAGVAANTIGSEDSFSWSAIAPPAVDADIPAEVRREAPEKTQTVKSSAERSKKPVARQVAVLTEKPSGSQTTELSREDQKAARKQARQERRRAEREKRDLRSADDLLRIRDIFEGSPRP